MGAENEKVTEEENELSDIEIAELANQELRKKNAEIDKLKKDLAKLKLLSTAEPDEEEPISREECIRRITDPRTTNYDYAEAVIGLCDSEAEAGNPSPLGEDGEEVYNFFKEIIEECDGDKSRFPAIYQARIGDDPKEIAMAYNKRNNENKRRR